MLWQYPVTGLSQNPAVRMPWEQNCRVWLWLLASLSVNSCLYLWNTERLCYPWHLKDLWYPAQERGHKQFSLPCQGQSRVLGCFAWQVCLQVAKELCTPGFSLGFSPLMSQKLSPSPLVYRAICKYQSWCNQSAPSKEHLATGSLPEWTVPQ